MARNKDGRGDGLGYHASGVKFEDEPDEIELGPYPNVRSDRPPFTVVKDVVLVRSETPGPSGYLDAIGNPSLPNKLRRRSLLGMLTCDPLLNIEAVAVLGVTPIEEE